MVPDPDVEIDPLSFDIPEEFIADSDEFIELDEMVVPGEKVVIEAPIPVPISRLLAFYRQSDDCF
jgi:hypothetical protein